MIRFLWSKIVGRCVVRCGKEDAEVFLGIIRDGNFSADSLICEGDFYSVTIPEIRAVEFERCAAEVGIEYTVQRLFGLPLLIYKYKRRPGIIIGVLLFFFIIGLSGRVIWDFEITGNKNISDIEIIEVLESLGCGPGAMISEIDFDMIQNDALLKSDNLAWISVNMDGNLARVEVREKRIVPIKGAPPKGSYANIVAAEDGVIELCKVRNGEVCVEIGDVVKKGELLISGVIDVGENDIRYEYADGEIMARVSRRIESFVPYKYTENVPTGEKKTDLTLKIFGKMIKLSEGGSIDYKLYGKIKEDRKLSLPFGITLPMRLERIEYSELTETVVNISEDEAMLLAISDAYTKLRDMTDSLQVISVREVLETNEEGVTVTLVVYGVTDISANLGFSVSDENTEENEDKLKDEENGNG